MGKNDESSSGLYQSTKHHGNTDGKDNDYSQSYDTPQKKTRSSSYGDKITTTTTPLSSTLPPPEK